MKSLGISLDRQSQTRSLLIQSAAQNDGASRASNWCARE
jgi:hypothetical protein